MLLPLNQQDCRIWYSRYEQRGLPWQALRFGKNRRPLPMRQTAHDSDGDTSEESTVAVGESQAKSPALKATARVVFAFRERRSAQIPL
jgi:hypothetical protein